jgi:hypothetical protein
MSLNSVLKYLENIGHFISDCTDTKELEIDLILGDVPLQTPRCILYKLEVYSQMNSKWDLDLAGYVIITLKSKCRTIV